MKYLLILLLLTGCGWKERIQSDINQEYTRVRQLIVDADKEGQTYIALSSYNIPCVTMTVSELATKDGWEPVGAVMPQVGRNTTTMTTYMTTYIQTLRKVDKTLVALNAENGRFKVERRP